MSLLVGLVVVGCAFRRFHNPTTTNRRHKPQALIQQTAVLLASRRAAALLWHTTRSVVGHRCRRVRLRRTGRADEMLLSQHIKLVYLSNRCHFANMDIAGVHTSWGCALLNFTTTSVAIFSGRRTWRRLDTQGEGAFDETYKCKRLACKHTVPRLPHISISSACMHGG